MNEFTQLMYVYAKATQCLVRRIQNLMLLYVLIKYELIVKTPENYFLFNYFL